MKIIFDMDGTLYDLYGQDDWLYKLKHDDASAYSVGKPLCDMVKLVAKVDDLISKGHQVEIVSWLAKNSTKEFDAATIKAKKEWLDKYNFKATAYHFVKYGTPKARFKGKGLTLLFDDDSKVREQFEKSKDCIAFNPTINNPIYVLNNIIE